MSNKIPNSKSKPQTLSVCLAVFNEEENIARVLNSVSDWADEIILVDGNSTDQTVEIAKSFGPKLKVFSQPNQPMFHINKQYALDQATGDWILQLDADEEVSGELREEIVKVLNCHMVENQSNNLAIQQFNNIQPIAYWVSRLNYFLGRFLKKGGQYPDYCLRLYKKGTVYFPCKSVHEQPEIKMQNEKVGYLKNPLLHYPYKNFQTYKNKWERYCDFDAYELIKKGLTPNLKMALEHLWFLPVWWFFKAYFRHLGFVDGYSGLVFSYYSALRYRRTYQQFQKLSNAAKSGK